LIDEKYRSLGRADTSGMLLTAELLDVVRIRPKPILCKHIKNARDFVKRKMVKKNFECPRPLTGAEFSKFPFLMNKIPVASEAR
jgi:hypothetical protein